MTRDKSFAILPQLPIDGIVRCQASQCSSRLGIANQHSNHELYTGPDVVRRGRPVLQIRGKDPRGKGKMDRDMGG